MVEMWATRSRSLREAGAQPGSRAESGSRVGPVPGRNREWVRFQNRVPLGNHVLSWIPDPHICSRTVGTDEGRDLPQTS